MLDHLGRERHDAGTGARGAATRTSRRSPRSRAAPTLDCAISVKLTQLGLDASIEACLRNLEPVLEAAGADGTQVMIDMESHPYVDATLEVLGELRERHANVGRLPAGLPAADRARHLRRCPPACASGW